MSDPFPLVPLGDVLIPISRPERVDPEKTYHILGTHWYAEGLYTKDIKTGATIQADKVYRVEQGDFVYNRLFAWKGSFALATAENDGCYVSNEFPCFIVKPDRAIGEYLRRYFSRENAWDEAFGLSTGGTPTSRNRLKEEKLLAMRIPLPPLAEQRRIVARIEELADKIAEARGLRRQAIEEASLLMPSLIDGTLSQGNGEIPETTVQAIARTVTDGDHMPPPKAEHGIPFVFISNVVKGRVTFDNCKWVSESYYTRIHSSRRPNSGDVLYTAVGATRGVPCIVMADDPFCFQRHIAIIKPKRDTILSEYLTWALASKSVYAQAIAGSTGSAQPTVPLRVIRALRFPLPLIPEQQRIVDYLDEMQAKVDALKRLQAETAAELDALLPAVLDRAFKGEL